jgi:hypothetical protein
MVSWEDAAFIAAGGSVALVLALATAISALRRRWRRRKVKAEWIAEERRARLD